VNPPKVTRHMACEYSQWRSDQISTFWMRIIKYSVRREHDSSASINARSACAPRRFYIAPPIAPDLISGTYQSICTTLHTSLDQIITSLTSHPINKQLQVLVNMPAAPMTRAEALLGGVSTRRQPNGKCQTIVRRPKRTEGSTILQDSTASVVHTDRKAEEKPKHKADEKKENNKKIPVNRNVIEYLGARTGSHSIQAKSKTFDVLGRVIDKENWKGS
jgi:hypothetical protein